MVLRRDIPLVPAAGIGLGAAAGLLIALLPVQYGLALVLAAGLTIATLIEPVAGLVGGLFLGLLRGHLLVEVPQVPAQLGHLFVALAVASWIGHGLARRDLRISIPPLTLPLLGFLFAGWLSLWSPADLGYGLPELVKWLEVLLALLIVADRVPPRLLPWLIGVLLLIGLFQAGVGLYESAIWRRDMEFFQIGGTGFRRAYGTFGQPNPYAGYISMTLALAVGLLTAVPRRPVAILLGAAILLLGAALVASWSRGGWIGFGAAAVAMAVGLPRRFRWGLALGLLLIAVGLLLYTAGWLPAAITARLSDLSFQIGDIRGVGITDANFALLERLAHWQAALQMWRYNFWAGVGLGCYEPAYPQFALINWPLPLGHAHNIYLNLLAETGLLGLAAYLILWGTVFWRTWQNLRTAQGLARGIALGLLGAWTHLTVHHLFDNLYVNNTHLLIGILFGVLASNPHLPIKRYDYQNQNLFPD